MITQWWAVLASYAAFAAALSAFLSVDSAMVAQLLTGYRHRAFALGLMNLTNTLPAIIVPGLTIAIGFYGPSKENLVMMLLFAAIMAAFAALAVSLIRSIR